MATDIQEDKVVMKPKVRGFICVTTHPEGCTAHVNEQIKYVQSQPAIQNGPKNVLVIGGSTGYGLSSCIAATFGCKAKTLSVFFERPPAEGRPGSPGWYNRVAFSKAAKSAGLYAGNVNGDAFSHAVKTETLHLIQKAMGNIDLVVYSLASPKRVDPNTGEVYKSALKPIGQPFSGKSVDTDKKLITQVSLEPASPEEIQGTINVMGGEDWQLWMKALQDKNLLAKDCKTIAYSYIGPEVTWPIYKNGTIGKAKEDLERAAKEITQSLQAIGGSAYVSINKAIVTQASSAIPVVPLYISILYKIMKEKGIHEGCMEQTFRLFADKLYNNHTLQLDETGRIRVDDWEMREEVQSSIKKIWPDVTSENLEMLTDFKGYQSDFLKLFGFGLPGIDYDKPVDLKATLPDLVQVG